MENPMWIDMNFEPNATATVAPLAPKTDAEKSLVIKSLHLSKFADKDADGNDILYPMLRAWGVDTVVVIGAWTEDCITSTAFEASDRYGLDVVIIPDALATATPSHTKAIEVMSSSCAKAVSCSLVS
jgi:nicotinamidase-related amidase